MLAVAMPAGNGALFRFLVQQVLTDMMTVSSQPAWHSHIPQCLAVLCDPLYSC